MADIVALELPIVNERIIKITLPNPRPSHVFFEARTVAKTNASAAIIGQIDQAFPLVLGFLIAFLIAPASRLLVQFSFYSH